MITVKTFPVNPLEENTYVVSDATCQAMIIDCGAMHRGEQEAVSAYLDHNGLHPVAHVLTHAHFDHVLGAPFLYETYGLAPRVHPADADLYTHMDQQMLMLMGRPLGLQLPPLGEPLGNYEEDENDNHNDNSNKCASRFTRDDAPSLGTLCLGSLRFRIIHTPGHTAGGVCLYCAEEKVLFSGDSLFRQSIGRTDLPGGNYQMLINALTRLFAWLPNDVTIYPGHGPATTSSFERQYNPFL